MRWRVDLRFGSVSFGEQDEEAAWNLYEDEGIRIVRCKDIFDEGEVVEGLPAGVDWRGKPLESN